MKPYYIHVADGIETRYAEKPADVPTMLIERQSGFEFTRTGIITLAIAPHERRPIQPQGDGWAIWEVENASVVWRRPVKRLRK
jgi:hypothetical protein